MLRSFITIYFAIIFAVSLSAQVETSDSIMIRKEYRDIEQVNHLWFKTQNASGLFLNPLASGSIGSISFSRSLNDFKRVQEAHTKNELRFSIERIDNVSKYIKVYSKFEIKKSKETDRSWSDVMRTYNSNPYISGSPIKGDYDDLYFFLQSKIASVRIQRFTFGLGLDYEVGDLSRLRDPRSYSRLEEYSVIPSATYLLNDKHTVGLSFKYGHRKEKIPNIITVQSDPTMMYYTFMGLEHANGVISGYNGFKREFVNQSLGIGLDYNFKNDNLQVLISASYDKGDEDVWQEYKGSPGHYNETIYKIKSFSTLRSDRFLHSLNINLSSNEGKATELKQELISTVNATTGVTSKHWNTLFEYKNRYTVDFLDLNIDYRLYSTQSGYDYNYYIGSGLHYQSANNKYNLPVSTSHISSIEVDLTGGYRLINKKSGKLWIEPKVSYLHSLDASLKLNDSATEYAKQVLIPDLAFYKASFINSTLAIQYIFPLNIKNISNLWYVKLQGEYLKTSSSMNRQSGIISIGIYTY